MNRKIDQTAQEKIPGNNLQLVTRWADSNRNSLVTELRAKPLRQIGANEILVRIKSVPTHGSFWLATDPSAVHPRIGDFLRDGEFVFGNGGVGCVTSCGSSVKGVVPGDYVSIFGHYACEHHDCVPCHEYGRYVECFYGEGKILGHGGGALDGTFAQYVILPLGTWVRCFKADEFPADRDLIPFMYSFLVADVRNALSGVKLQKESNSILLFGAGLSGHIAVALLLSAFSREIRIIVADPDDDNLRSIRRLAPDMIRAVSLPRGTLLHSNSPTQDSSKNDLHAASSLLARVIDEFFPRKRADLIFECSSGDSQIYWANTLVLRPRTMVILFGFGLKNLVLSPELLQTSGLEIRTSRGVGDRENMEEAVVFIKEAGFKMINRFILDRAKRFDSLEIFLDYALGIARSQGEQIPRAISYICPE